MQKLERLAQAKVYAYNAYCSTGEDCPTWEEWLKDMQIILAKRYKRTILSHSIAFIDGRSF